MPATPDDIVKIQKQLTELELQALGRYLSHPHRLDDIKGILGNAINDLGSRKAKKQTTKKIPPPVNWLGALAIQMLMKELQSAALGNPAKAAGCLASALTKIKNIKERNKKVKLRYQGGPSEVELANLYPNSRCPEGFEHKPSCFCRVVI